MKPVTADWRSQSAESHVRSRSVNPVRVFPASCFRSTFIAHRRPGALLVVEQQADNRFLRDKLASPGHKLISAKMINNDRARL